MGRPCIVMRMDDKYGELCTILTWIAPVNFHTKSNIIVPFYRYKHNLCSYKWHWNFIYPNRTSVFITKEYLKKRIANESRSWYCVLPPHASCQLLNSSASTCSLHDLQILHNIIYINIFLMANMSNMR